MSRFKKELSIITSKKDVTEGLVWDDVSSCNHNISGVSNQMGTLQRHVIAGNSVSKSPVIVGNSVPKSACGSVVLKLIASESPIVCDDLLIGFCEFTLKRLSQIRP